MNRRNFLKGLGIGAVGAGVSALISSSTSKEIPVVSKGVIDGQGANITYYGMYHVTQANDSVFRTGHSEILVWDSTLLEWNIEDTQITGVKDLKWT